MEFIKNVLSYVVIVWLVLPGGIRTEFLDKSGICKVANSDCETRYWCKEGFTEVNQFCLGKIDTQCSMTTDCIPDAMCANFSGSMHCECRDGFKAALNKKECRLKVGSPCNVTAAQYCIHNAVCDVTLGTCTCEEGYSTHNNNSECLGNVGSTCTTKSECIQQAMCTGSTCTCEDMYTPSYDKSKCIGYVHAPCDTKSTSCVSNADCIQGQCQCNDGYHGSTFCNEAEIEQEYHQRLMILLLVGWAGWVVVVLIVICCVVYQCCCKRCRNTKKQPSKK